MSIESDSPVVYHGTSESRFPNNEVQAPQIIPEITAEEKDILRQCNKESLYYRCLPFAIAGMAATQLAVRKGYMTPHPVWGTTLSMTGAAFLGWIVGKVSYKTKCEDKFVHLENSVIGEVIRKKRGISFQRYQNDFTKTQPSGDDLTLRDDSSFSYYSDSNYHPSTGSLNLDVDKNILYSGLDDRERPSTDRETMPFIEESGTGITKKFATYEEFRHRNRDEYERSQRSYPSRMDDSQSNQRSRSNLDSTPATRYMSDLSDRPSVNIERRRNPRRTNWDSYKGSLAQDIKALEDSGRRKDGDVWDNVKKF